MKKNMVKKAGIAAAVMAIAVASSANTSLAAEVNTDNFVRTSFDVNGTSSAAEEEIIENVDEKWNIIDMTDSGRVDNMTRTADYLYEWTLKPSYTYEVGSIYRKKGSTITIGCCLDGYSDKYVVAGIIEPDSTARAVKDKDAVAHTFDINTTGYYRVFARNINSTTIKVGFIYSL